MFESEWFPDKKLEVTVINDTENTIQKLNLQIRDRTTELEASQMFVKEQFYLIKKSSTEIDPNRNEIRNVWNFFNNKIKTFWKKTNQKLPQFKCLLKIRRI